MWKPLTLMSQTISKTIVIALLIGSIALVVLGTLVPILAQEGVSPARFICPLH